MSFFQSEVVRAEMAEIHELQEEVYSNVFKFLTMSNEDKAYHIDILEKLVDKQRVMYTRLSLSDDPEAKKMKEQIIESASMMGFPKNSDINKMWDDMNKMVKMMKQQIDKESES
jgi:hypothetical protein|tara:strand:- start:19 stop:360 length:342 start_codon:yes stop_codon:yes gene_type:complete